MKTILVIAVELTAIGLGCLAVAANSEFIRLRELTPVAFLLAISGLLLFAIWSLAMLLRCTVDEGEPGSQLFSELRDASVETVLPPPQR